MSLEFRAVVTPYGAAGGIELTEDQAALLGPAKQPPVTVTVEGRTVRVRVSRMSGAPCVFFSRANRQALGIEIGDEVDCIIALDTAERVVVPPPLLAEALAADSALAEAWGKLSYSHQREWAMSIDDAKRTETKQRRLAQLRAKLLPPERRTS